MSVDISVIIPNLNSSVIGEVLGSLQTQAEALSEKWEVWVVGQDRPGQVRSGGHIRLIETLQPVPPSQARNIGAAAAQSETLIFLDADCVPQPGWLVAILGARSRWPEAGAISGAMLANADTFVLLCGQLAAFHEHLSLNRAGWRQTLASFSLLVPRSVWQATGGFDEQLKFAAAEDLDFSIRVAALGRNLFFEPRATVLHKPQRDGWYSLWQHALRGGAQSVTVRHRHADYYKMPAWTKSPWGWRFLSPAIALVRTLQIYVNTPHSWRYWRCAPWVVLSKLGWCWGAATGLDRRPMTTHHKDGG
jgi:glycosyltransferase involved in cell wall biosynthesis